MKNLPLNFMLFVLMLISACTASEKTIGESGLEKDYQSALNKLKSGNTSQKQIALLSTTLTTMISQQEPIKDSLLQTNQLADTEKAFEINQYLLVKIFPTLPYVDKNYKATFDKLKIEEEKLQTELQTIFFEKGKTNLDEAIAENNKEKARFAFEAFEKSVQYGKAEATVAPLKQKSLDFAMLVYHVTIDAPADKRYNILLDDRFREVENINRKFKKIYFQRENLEAVDCTLEIVLDPLQNHIEDRSNTQTFERKVQTGTTTTTDGNGNSKETPVYQTVMGTLTKNTKVKVFRWNTVIKIHSNSPNCTLTSSQFQEIFESASTKISISGDERAIPEGYQNVEEQMMTDQEAVEQLIEQIYFRIQSNVL